MRIWPVGCRNRCDTAETKIVLAVEDVADEFSLWCALLRAEQAVGAALLTFGNTTLLNPSEDEEQAVRFDNFSETWTDTSVTDDQALANKHLTASSTLNVKWTTIVSFSTGLTSHAMHVLYPSL